MKSLINRIFYFRRIKQFKSRILPGSILIDHWGTSLTVETIGKSGVIGSRISGMYPFPVSGSLSWEDIGELISEVKNPSDEIELDKLEVK